MAHVGEILAELRNDRELSQKELGRVLHIGGGTISCYERGSSLPNSDRIVQIADYFHVTTDCWEELPIISHQTIWQNPSVARSQFMIL